MCSFPSPVIPIADRRQSIVRDVGYSAWPVVSINFWQSPFTASVPPPPPPTAFPSSDVSKGTQNSTQTPAPNSEIARSSEQPEQCDQNSPFPPPGIECANASVFKFRSTDPAEGFLGGGLGFLSCSKPVLVWFDARGPSFWFGGPFFYTQSCFTGRPSGSQISCEAGLGSLLLTMTRNHRGRSLLGFPSHDFRM